MLLVFAYYLEAVDTIKRVNAQKIAPNLYTFPGGKILLTGLGIHAAQAAISKYSVEHDEIWNFGFAGALQEFPLFELVSIGQITKYVPVTLDEHSQTQMEEHLVPQNLEGDYNLLTSDFPIHDEKFRHKNCHLVDMEGYGIAYAANYLGKKCRMWKIVSDFARPGGPQLIRENLSELSKLLADKVEDESYRHARL